MYESDLPSAHSLVKHAGNENQSRSLMLLAGTQVRKTSPAASEAAHGRKLELGRGAQEGNRTRVCIKWLSVGMGEKSNSCLHVTLHPLRGPSLLYLPSALWDPRHPLCVPSEQIT